MKTRKIIKLLPFALLLCGLILFFVLGLHKHLDLGEIYQQREKLSELVDQLGLIAPIAYSLLYILVTAFSIPGAVILTLFAGFLFGLWVGLASVVIGATCGACIVFSAVKLGFGDKLKNKAKGNLERLRAGFQRDAFNYLLVLRLIPLFPFWLINIVAALLNVKFKSFLSATLLGIIPGSLVYVSLGNGINSIIDAGQQPDLNLILEPKIILPILALAALSLIHVIYKRYRVKHARD